MAFCDQCGQRLEERARFCPNCGAPRAGTASPEAPQVSAGGPSPAETLPSQPEPSRSPSPSRNPSPNRSRNRNRNPSANAPRARSADPKAELVGQLGELGQTPAVVAAGVIGLGTFAVVFVAGFVLAALPDASLIGFLGADAGYLEEAFRQMVQLVLAGFENDALFEVFRTHQPRRAGPFRARAHAYRALPRPGAAHAASRARASACGSASRPSARCSSRSS